MVELDKKFNEIYSGSGMIGIAPNNNGIQLKGDAFMNSIVNDLKQTFEENGITYEMAMESFKKSSITSGKVCFAVLKAISEYFQRPCSNKKFELVYEINEIIELSDEVFDIFKGVFLDEAARVGFNIRKAEKVLAFIEGERQMMKLCEGVKE